jgi:hypothetical protein
MAKNHGKEYEQTLFLKKRQKHTFVTLSNSKHNAARFSLLEDYYGLHKAKLSVFLWGHPRNLTLYLAV